MDMKGLRELREELLDARQSRCQLRRRAGIADAQRARLAERGTRHAGDALGFEQRTAEIDVVADRKPGRLVGLAERDADVWERVERAVRFRAHHAGDRG